MLYRPEVSQLIHLDMVSFTPKRWIKLPYRIFLHWIKNEGGLREPTPIPYLMESEMKPEYYWCDLIH